MPAEVHAGDDERIERRIERGGVVPSDQSMRRDFEGRERESQLVRVGLQRGEHVQRHNATAKSLLLVRPAPTRTLGDYLPQLLQGGHQVPSQIMQPVVQRSTRSRPSVWQRYLGHWPPDMDHHAALRIGNGGATAGQRRRFCVRGRLRLYHGLQFGFGGEFMGGTLLPRGGHRSGRGLL